MSPPREKLVKELVVQNRSGIHARVSTMIAQRCKDYTSEVRLWRGTTVADCRSVLDLLSLGASNGTTVRLEVEGDDATEVVKMVTALFEARFNEDEESSKPPETIAPTESCAHSGSSASQ